MSTADTKRDEAIKHIQQAIEAISEIVVKQCDGFDDFNSTYRLQLQQALNQMLTVRDTLK